MDAVVAFYTDGMTEFTRDAIGVEAKMAAALSQLVGDTASARPAKTIQMPFSARPPERRRGPLAHAVFRRFPGARTSADFPLGKGLAISFQQRAHGPGLAPRSHGLSSAIAAASTETLFEVELVSARSSPIRFNTRRVW